MCAENQKIKKLDHGGLKWQEMVRNGIIWIVRDKDAGVRTTFFVGEFTHALDSKGRVTIPSKWRLGGDNTYLALPNPWGIGDRLSSQDGCAS